MTRWLIWSSVVVVWTVGLEVPVLEPGDVPGGEFIVTNKFVFAKSLHVAMYGLLAAFSASLPMPGRYRCLMMFFLLGHAWGTEMLQQALEPWCKRGGSLVDVGFDFLGVALGVALTWKWWMKP